MRPRRRGWLSWYVCLMSDSFSPAPFILSSCVLVVSHLFCRYSFFYPYFFFQLEYVILVVRYLYRFLFLRKKEHVHGMDPE